MKLSRSDRSKLFAGDPVKLIFPGSEPCPYPKGHVEALSKHVWLEVTEIRRTAEGDHSLGYTLHNNKLGARFLANQHGQTHPEQYVSSPAGAIDPEAGEAVDDFTQKRITREARAKERLDLADLIVAAEQTLNLVKARGEQTPSLKREYFRIRRELDRLIEREKRKAA